MSIPYTTLQNLYGETNAVLDEFFPANSYINFGYYPHPFAQSKQITLEERLASQKALYEHLFQFLDPLPEDHILEVGCGRGDGAAYLATTFPVASVKGIDLTPQQVMRAKTKHQSLIQKGLPLDFLVGSAEELPLPNHSLHKIYSVEAAQHFASLPQFAAESLRTLKPGGRVAITTFFATDAPALAALHQLMPINIGSVDNVKPLNALLTAFQSAGFACSHCEKIGKWVFPFFDQWLAQRKTQDWGRLWTQAWRQGLLDYYSVVFTR